MNPSRLGTRSNSRTQFRLAFEILRGLILFTGFGYCSLIPGHTSANETRTTKQQQEEQEQDSVDASKHRKEKVEEGGPSPRQPGPVQKVDLPDELKNHVVYLAQNIGERNLVKYKQLCQAADYVEKQLTSFGYPVTRQTFQVRGVDCHNIIAERKGTTKPDEIVIIGGHYDSARGTPGANDNGSGTARMLALARMLKDEKPARTLRFIGFTNEEPPYFQNEGEMGSWVYARHCRKNDEKIVGVISLETMGYFSDEENSQKYPPPLNLLYPSTGNFIGFVSDLSSRTLLESTLKKFREHATIPSEGATLPAAMQGVGWSDHWSFWQEGYQGIMITDTAPFRYPHYHLQSDTPDKIDFNRLGKVVEGLRRVVLELAK